MIRQRKFLFKANMKDFGITFRFITSHLTKGVPTNTRNHLISYTPSSKIIIYGNRSSYISNSTVRDYTSRLDNDPAGIAHRSVHWLPKPGRWVRFPLPALNSPFV